MRVGTTTKARKRRFSSICNNIIQIQNGTFYREHPASSGTSTAKDSRSPLFPNLDFSLSAFPLKRDTDNGNEQQHWAVIGSGGSTTFLEVLRGSHICLPPNARTFPYLSSNEIEAKNHRLRSPTRAIQYVGFASSKRQGLGGGTQGSYLSARYESRREETDWSVLQYLRGETELNPSQELRDKDARFEALLSDVVQDLRLKRLTSMPVSNLSNGQTRRARIAKALLGRPEVLLLDEPFMGLDPPTLVSLSPILRELAYKSSPRLIMSLRPQDPIPDWITHLVVLGFDHTIALAGPKDKVLFAVYRWGNASGSQKGGTTHQMAALMTKRYGEALTDVGHKLSADGVSQYKTYSEIMLSRDPIYIHHNGEMVPEHLNSLDEKRWREAAEQPREKADLDDLLALTCLLPSDFNCQDVRPSRDSSPLISTSLEGSTTEDPLVKRPCSSSSDPLIELTDVVVSYGSKIVLGQGIQPCFSSPGLNLTIREGTRLALLGPNGSGKTTLLSLLTSDHPQSYSLPIKYFGRRRLPSPGQPGLSLWEIQSRVGHSSPEIHVFFPRGLTIRRTLESAWAETFSAKPKLTDERKKLVDTFLEWWDPELNPSYNPLPSIEPFASPVDEWMSMSYPPLQHSKKTVKELNWASAPTITFGALTFQSQRLLLLLRAIIKRPDIVILDEAFSGFSPAIREKAMLFLSAGDRRVLLRRQATDEGSLVINEGDSNGQKSAWKVTRNRRFDIEKICRNMAIKVDDLLVGKEKISPKVRSKVDHLRNMTATQLDAMVTDEDELSEHTFTGLKQRQALIVVSHVREEIPDVVNEYVKLPGEEEVTEQGRSVEMGICEHGEIRTVKGWNRIWGFGS